LTEKTSAKPARRPQTLSGFRDHLPAQMILRRRIIDTFRGIFERHGFEPIETPALEHLEVLTGKAGENEKLMYQWEDLGGRRVGLRYDLTVPLARFFAVHESEVVIPFKRYHIAPVWRAEKPQRGRFREFWQCDADIVGSASMLADAEAISILAESLIAVGLPNFIVHISHRRLLEGVALSAGIAADQASSVFRSIDKLPKIGANGVRTELIGLGVDENAADKLLDAVTESGSSTELIASLQARMSEIPSGLAAVDELAELFELLPALGVPERAYILDVSLARGLDYYTGPVYEALVDEPKVGSVAGAGRYDGLIGNFIGRSIPATGMSLGLERIIEVVEEFDLLPTQQSVASVMVTNSGGATAVAAAMARELRDAGINTDLSLLTKRSIGDQLKYADRRKIPFAIVLNAVDPEHGLATVKSIATGEEWMVKPGELNTMINRLLIQPVT
jgi:histidyl-tRNA synthetase